MTLQVLTKNQIVKIKIFQDQWAVFLSHLATTFFGVKVDKPVERGLAVVWAMIDRIYQTALNESRGTMDLNRLVMLFGYIAGNQFGQSIADGKFPLDPAAVSESLTGSAAMFEAAARVACEEVLAMRDKPRIVLPDGGVRA